ncbi:tRNA adenosine(34) deaminase TadA [Microbulbifer thermotolerans]|uniref:tRNA-specific adenosine deaminase n=1 Tax=Microbulbifer thermotolerans TaxID=252514 RepID=A0A143HNP0_MICTH|nr:tRNA adenosine(34) deaminase TadA [Microbulbifer thermotolerans]AMX03050.1 tRNA-specific adenosine deaminase [Microbulbifer thermotolerans]MCX2779014.1 tRNA adenosine(34) deaminase TadA [Microbulbifer thermotolerans]MCX2781475.1 tRNA adenosine(34) deaminase TadA [Microbulbifer thermotolerans]MCX2795714.1 tRNA adenosine(34) deaminase TadA [Microbulbifer thermotolerans]MCX2802044.1 tRNA adenosine(34) deaminase TadA [Microbulbifer thermotolerans]
MATPRDYGFMRRALELAEIAGARGEVPVGAVLVFEGEVIGEGSNRPIGNCDPSAHAEVIALRRGAERMRNYRLPQTTLYVTIEPCTMCFGAMIHARVGRLVYGASEPRAGAVESRLQLGASDFYNHKISVEGGVLAEEAAALVREFFADRR